MLLDCTVVIAFLLIVSSVVSQNPWIQGEELPGQTCRHTKDCASFNARCFDGKCLCLTSHVLVNGQCLPKIQPGMSGCGRSEQCDAIWPGARCVNSICVCPANALQVRTRTGVVCLEDFASCPFGGREAVLRDENGRPATCYVNPRSGYMSGCLGHMHMYDCIQNTHDTKATNTYYCCPTQANVCSQPRNEGEAPKEDLQKPFESPDVLSVLSRTLQGDQSRIAPNVPWYHRDDGTMPRAPLFRQPVLADNNTRWYYDRISAECTAFRYRGAGGNANNFRSQSQCQYFCRSTCPRGHPMTTQTDPDGKVHQFAQRTQMCNPADGCSDPQYSCLHVMPGKALCCPDRNFICGPQGGHSQVAPGPFHQGVACGSGKLAERRYYFDSDAGSCLPFEYLGCSGNHNNFVSLIECQRFCGTADEFDRQNDDARITHLGDIDYEFPEPDESLYINTNQG